MYGKAHQNYRDNEILTADPLRLVELLYRGAMEAIAEAGMSLQRGDIAGRARQIGKATAILNELARSLDHARAPEISRPLAELYDYMARRLNEANFLQVSEPLNEVHDLLSTLVEAWQVCNTKADSRHTFVREPIAEYQPLSCSF